MNNSTYIRYKGACGIYSGCSDPSVLTKGQIYKLIDVKAHEWGTSLVLEDVEGEFDSTWFEPVATFLGFVETVPKIGDKLRVERMERLKDYKGVTRIIPSVYWSTPARYVEILGPSTYKVVTDNTVYIVQVL